MTMKQVWEHPWLRDGEMATEEEVKAFMGARYEEYKRKQEARRQREEAKKGR